MKGIRCTAVGMAAAMCFLGFGISIRARSQQIPPTIVSMPDPTVSSDHSDEPNTELFPLLWEDGSLVAHHLVDYEGPYLEDGSDLEVCTAALLLENKSENMVEFVRITVTQGGITRIFEATYLPPGTQALIVDKNQHPYSPDSVESCHFSCLRTIPKMSSWVDVYVSGTGLCYMIATNLTDEAIDCVRIFYKQLVPQTDIYLGGVTYCVVITDLQPGESRKISPYHYITKQADILGVVTEDAASHTENLPAETIPPADYFCYLNPA